MLFFEKQEYCLCKEGSWEDSRTHKNKRQGRNHNTAYPAPLSMEENPVETLMQLHHKDFYHEVVISVFFFL